MYLLILVLGIVLLPEDGSEYYESTRRSCVLPEECGEHSLNVGFYRDVIASKCCNTDLCNTQPPPEITPPVPSGIKCTTCDEQGCNAAVNCLGNEDRCISATVFTPGYMTTMKACASKAQCLYIQTALMTETTAAEVNCCQGDYCNSASSTSAGLMLLVAPLISLVLS
ncbi:urokinase plasminogen activator surface receptor-like [Mugil cephalus]|uniref:urokinase plasminogen activator surface receptor-like n=1 Tax=Mugil cephalus TaxID=48193 RepID=UPI001FB6D3B8|nr:urokinase plasminogen activator surface receptor-like [Mugil cephalus]